MCHNYFNKEHKSIINNCLFFVVVVVLVSASFFCLQFKIEVVILLSALRIISEWFQVSSIVVSTIMN